MRKKVNYTEIALRLFAAGLITSEEFWASVDDPVPDNDEASDQDIDQRIAACFIDGQEE